MSATVTALADPAAKSCKSPEGFEAGFRGWLSRPAFEAGCRAWVPTPAQNADVASRPREQFVTSISHPATPVPATYGGGDGAPTGLRAAYGRGARRPFRTDVV